MRVGDLEVTPLIDGEFRANPKEVYPSIVDWEPHKKWLTHDGMLEMAIGCFLVRTDSRVVLIDAGLGGTLTIEGFTGGRLIDELAKSGLKPDDITDVVFTHLHFDHVGWATQKGTIVFPNATYRCDAKDWSHFVGDDGTREGGRKLFPVRDRLETFDGGTTLAPGVDTLPTPGHTPGHAAIVVSSGTDRVVILGDAAHCPLELEESEIDGLGDVDPALAKRTRNAIMRELEESGTPASAPHFPGLQFGRLLRAEGRPQWVIS
jgi:glyoxylase-like metal-dependent hydrolase (beta-lactamase superfamily II)